MIGVVSILFICAFGRVMDGGACTDDDVAAMNAAGGGHADNSFPGINAACAETSWSIFKGFEEDKFVTCLVGKISISDDCAMCFAGYGNYGYDNCKAPCLSNWCSETCLSCAEVYDPTLEKCAGLDNTTIPQPTSC